MMRSASLFATVLCCSLGTVWGSETVDVPIVIGGARSVPACPGGGEVVGLDSKGDNFLSVRSGPGGRGYREVDRVYTGMHLKICDMDGPWFGVVYAPPDGTEDCDVDRPWIVRKAYVGRCRQGWVYS